MSSDELVKDLAASKTKRELIRILETGGTVNISEIARKIGRNKSTVSRHIAILEKAGLVTRKKGPLNRRKDYFSLAERGREMAKRMH